MKHYKYLHKTAFIQDGMWLIGINLILLVIFAHYDVLEMVINFAHDHEGYELDELLPLSATLTISLGIFTYRRLVELGRVTEAFETLAKTDPLTGSFNRRAGQAILHRSHAKASLTGQGFTVVQLNIDNFKRINDLYGSSVGDDILINLVNIINNNTPLKSKLIHWHSDNFILVLPSQLTSPFEFANKLRETIAQQLFTTDTITCSFGLTSWEKGVSLQEMLHNVDDALMDAKAANKNTVKMV